MLELGIYSILDEKADRFDTPFPAVSDLNAKRHFIIMLSKNGSLVSTFRNDFSLHKVATFNVQTGEMLQDKNHLLDGKSVEKEENER